MNIDHLDRVIKGNSELSAHQEYLDAIAKPSVDIAFAPGKPDNQATRFGGVPLVAKDFVWPEHPKGEYRFLGQINFSDIENCPPDLPESGLLSLFYAFDEDGEIFWGSDGYVLGFYWPDTDTLVLHPGDSDTPTSGKVILNTGKDIPRYEELRQDWPFDTEALYFIHNFLKVPEYYLLGYPSFYTLGYDPTPGDDWISLITLDSEECMDWNWHDGSKLMVFIEKSKLKNKDFSNLKTDAG